MKKKISRVISIITLLAVLLCFPVSAASSGWNEYALTMDEIYDGGAVDTTALQGYINAPNVTEWESFTVLTKYLYGDGGGGDLPITGVRYRMRTGTYLTEWGFGKYGDTFTAGVPFPVFYSPLVSAGSVFSISADTILIGLDPSYGVVSAVRLGISQVDANYQHIKSYSYTLDLAKENRGNYHYYDNLFSIKTVNRDSYFCVSYVEVDFTLVGSGQGSLSVTIPNGFTFSYGNPNSPEAPKYNKPDDGGAVGDLDDLEGELGSQTQDGMNSANDTFGSFAKDLTEFTLGLQFVSVLMRTFIFKMPWLNALLTVSLGLGLFGFIVALAGSAIGGSDKNAKSHVRQDAEFIKRDGIASHRPSRRGK